MGARPSRLLDALHRPLGITLPLTGIIGNIFSNTPERGFIADDVLELIVLPQPSREPLPPTLVYPGDVAVGGQRLEGPDDLP